LNTITISLLVFACVFGASLVGMLLRRSLPDHHLSRETQDSVKLAMGLVATMAALVLGLLISSAKASYDTQSSEVAQLAANVALLDRVLAHYGPETGDLRERLRRGVERAIDLMWPSDRSGRAQLDPTASGGDDVYDRIQTPTPRTDIQRSLQASATQLMADIGRTRSLLFAQGGTTIPMPFLVVLIFWAGALFVSFGLFATPNATVVVSLLVCALSVAGAIFLILELAQPFHGFIQVSSAPLRETLAHRGK